MKIPPAVEELSDVTAAIIAGGAGTRLRSVVSDRPKALAEVRGRPFMSFLLDQLVAAGVRTAVLCIGYLGEQIRTRFGGSYGSLRLLYSEESAPLGTGGALRAASVHFTSSFVLAMNGDSFCAADLKVFRRWHRARGANATMLLAKVADGNRYGRVEVDSADRVVRFDEKGLSHGPQWINAGVYLISRSLITCIPAEGAPSLEKQVFPSWIHRGLYGFKSEGRFLDIGTPESYAAAESFFSAEIPQMEKRRYVLLDRDGTIIAERHYLAEPSEVELLPGAAAGLRRLSEMGLGLVVITNQSGVGRGFFDRTRLERIHRRMRELLEACGVRIDKIYSCVHTPGDGCACRKPNTGLADQAAAELGFDLGESFVIGDNAGDVEMGRRLGAQTFLVRTGYGARVAEDRAASPDYVVDDLAEAAGIIGGLLGGAGRKIAG